MTRKKSLILIILMVMSIISLPSKALATSIDLSEYTSLTLKQAFDDEDIEYDFSNYQETDDQVTIYLFRGHGCSYCSKFLNYLADTLLDEYGQYFKVVTYEVWYNSSNSELMQQVADFLGDDANGVPYIVIGDKTFIGFEESMGSEIKGAILDLYNSTDRYDVFEAMASDNTTSSSKEAKTTSNTVAIVIWDIIIVLLATVIILCFNRHNKKELEKEILEIKATLKKIQKEQKKTL